MAQRSGEWNTDFSPRSLTYITDHRLAIRDAVGKLGLDNSAALGIAGAIAREETAQDYIYADWIKNLRGVMQGQISEITQKTHAEIASAYQAYLANPNLNSIVKWDLFTIGKIRIATAIGTLIKYQSDYPGDDLSLQTYFNDYQTFVTDLIDATKDTAAKIAALIVKNDVDYLTGRSMPPGQPSSPAHNPSKTAIAQWNEYSEGERAAILVKSYATGLATLETIRDSHQ